MQDVIPHLPALFLIFGALAAGYASPGPTMLAVMGTALGRGRGPGVLLGLGVALGTGLWAGVSVTLLGPLLPMDGLAVEWLRIGAAVFLAFLALVSFRSAITGRDLSLPTIGGTGPSLILRGTLIAATNPKAAVFWLAVAVAAIGPETGWTLVAVLVAGSLAISALGHTGYALAFSSPRIAAAYRDRRRVIQSVLGCVFCVLSVVVLTGARHRGIT
ncbi:LysE family translocator [Palleronia abyssalis]|uniref:Threonine efflux protein n=1 Tax=Palleronia abyssalis TaxID=1501240 RepID=A0A2R8C1H5_9RHOB|nr:LysE family transporter [Palleronia abyssalis]SPJ26252.1 Threonine efflux protein [Palleronia abyssalis]